MTAALFRRTAAGDMRAAALRDRPPATFTRRMVGGNSGARLLSLSVGFTALFAAAVILPERAQYAPDAPWAVAVLVAALVILSWVMVHVSYAQHYAMVFYDAGDSSPAFEFADGSREPLYWDFAYLSFMVGMTFGTTDVAVRSAAARRAVLGHGVLSFGYNTVILGLIISFLVARAA